MNLEEFVVDILVNLDNAVERARQRTSRDVSFSQTSDRRTVEFDIAVSAEHSDSKSGKAGVKVLQFADAGGQLSTTMKNSTVSRVQFGLNIDSMTKDEIRSLQDRY